ncbi:Rhombotin-1 [Trachymyrmex septentrionalis]|uniref:Rhombotin-1 n=1 Tax=Trachymyrmex septentrionalis TaxID=34720 RepID=A0A195F2V9_9HYME|nr:Rhombotin-1 [Trachymyrmex septentrionalis]
MGANVVLRECGSVRELRTHVCKQRSRSQENGKINSGQIFCTVTSNKNILSLKTTDRTRRLSHRVSTKSCDTTEGNRSDDRRASSTGRRGQCLPTVFHFQSRGSTTSSSTYRQILCAFHIWDVASSTFVITLSSAKKRGSLRLSSYSYLTQMHVSLFLAVRALNDLGIPRFLCLLRGVRIPLVYPRALNGRWAIRANGLRARQIRSTAIPAASIHFEFLPLVDFLLAFTAPATWKHLISITAMRLGNITSSFTSGRVLLAPKKKRNKTPICKTVDNLAGFVVGSIARPTLYHILSAANIGNRYVPPKLSPACFDQRFNSASPEFGVTSTRPGAIANCPRRKKKGTNERTLVLQSGTSHKSHFTRYILNSVPVPGKTRLKIVAQVNLFSLGAALPGRTGLPGQIVAVKRGVTLARFHAGNSPESNSLSRKIKLEVISKPAESVRRSINLASGTVIDFGVNFRGLTRDYGIGLFNHINQNSSRDNQMSNYDDRKSYLLKALDMFWHEDCLKCGCCDCRLGEVGSTLYTKANLILCKRDYLRLFGNTGHCAACSKVIPAFEMVMRARTNVYHLECFACQQCNHRFCVGDRFYLCDNKILCEYDYEERLVFANMALHPPPSATLAHIKRQVTHLQPPVKQFAFVSIICETCTQR